MKKEANNESFQRGVVYSAESFLCNFNRNNTENQLEFTFEKDEHGNINVIMHSNEKVLLEHSFSKSIVSDLLPSCTPDEVLIYLMLKHYTNKSFKKDLEIPEFTGPFISPE